MAPLKLQRIVTCSSQDPAFPAENLLKSGTSNRWKCKAGEQTATVIIQLDRSSAISGIDVGNESSAFVEVLVGRESVPDDFKVILPMSSFMTPMDSRNEEQTNRVRIFRQDDLHKPECTEKWDRIKIVCTQPFNKFLKYGLAFITLHASEPAPEQSAPTQLGRFTLKDSDDDISVGSIFARRKEEPEPDPTPPTAAGSWRDAAKASSSKIDSEKKKAPKKDLTPKLKTNDSNSNKRTPSSDKAKATPNKKASDESKRTPSRKYDVKNEQKAKSPTPRAPAKRPSQDETSSSRKEKQMKLNPNVIYKPFNKLLEGVELVISGYVNPGRADIRTKALEMGAKYRPDWMPTCTHLICAFANTPKFQQVKGKGKIVKRDWIDDCFKERKQLPWRRYAVDPADQAGPSDANEKEVWELNENTKNTSNAVGRRNAISSEDTSLSALAEDSSSDTEEEIERIRMAQNKNKRDASKREGNSESSSPKLKREESRTTQSKHRTEEKKTDPENAIFDVSTDEETENEPSNNLPELPSIFKNKFFYIHPSLSKRQIDQVERYIVAFCGTLCEVLDDNVHFVITESKDDSEDDAPGVFYVRPEWIWKCNDAGRIVPFRDHEL